MSNLPIYEVMDALKTALAENRSAVLIAPPGAGKTTAVPLALTDEAWLDNRKVIVLEPRRLAARTAARTMAKLLGEAVGQTVGYRMRLDKKVSSETRVELVTEGVFQQMILNDPELTGVGCIIFDEFHERSLDADFGLALALEVQSALRDDLRILVMSATLDGHAVSALLGGTPLIESRGRMHEVEIRYLPPNPGTKIDEAMAGAVRKALQDEQGSILCFLPGQAEIRRTHEHLKNRLPENAFVAPLFGAMDIADQAAAVEPPPHGKRKIVLATSLAETSITIQGVRIVIDSGLSRVSEFEPALGLTRLNTRRASKASIRQRAGRAGRTEPGIAIRLWAEPQTASLPEFDDPEIMTTDMSAFLLNCLNWGTTDIASLALLDQPPAAHVLEAERLLAALGAVDKSGSITAKGKSMCAAGLEPRLAAMVLASDDPQARCNRAFLALLLGERGVGGHAIDIAERYEKARAEKSGRAKQLRNLAARIAGQQSKGPSDMEQSVGLALCDAFPDRVAKRRSNQCADYTMVSGRGVSLDELDPLARQEFIVVADMSGAAKSARVLSAVAVTEVELKERFSTQIKEQDRISFDAQSGRLARIISTGFGAIDFRRQNATVEPGPETTAALMAALQTHGLDLLNWSKAATGLRKRLRWLNRNFGEEWPDMSDKSLLETADEWLEPFLVGVTSFAHINDETLKNALMARVPYNLQASIDRLAPSHFDVPTGSRIALDYQTDGAPTLSVRVQELFGLSVHPTIGEGRIPLNVELLSPAHRPIQITKDLPAFWTGSWRDVCAEMRGRYPRHEWPEHPANAVPTRRAKPRKS